MALPQIPQLQAPEDRVGNPPQVGLTETNPDTRLDPQKPDLARLKRYFGEFRDLTEDPRNESLIDIDLYDSHQWTSEEKAQLRLRKQPDTVNNRIKPAVEGILGVVARGKSDPRAWPRTPQDEGSADVATDVLRYVADFNRFGRTKLDVYRDMLVPGTMAAIVGADEDLNPTITQVRWEEFFYDPRSRRKDFKDARYLGIAKWMYADDLAAMYPDMKSDISAAVDNSVAGGMTPDASFQDRPNWAITGWVDRKQRRILVVEMYYREVGNWLRCVFHGSGILEAGDSPYQDHKGKPHCPIEAQSAFVDRENRRYGVVRDMRGLQSEVNKRGSKLLHLLSVSQIQADNPGAITVQADEARKEAARPDGVIPCGWKKVPTTDMAMGQAQLLAQAKADMERMAPNPAILGRDGNDQSGRALLARQQAGLVELATLYAGMDDWELRIYRQCWARVKQFWRAPQYVRVTDDQGAPRFVQVNEPVMGPPSVGVDPQTGQPAIVPNVLGYKNNVGEMDVDIEVDTQQDVGTLAQEQFSDLMQMLQSNPAWQQQIPLEVMIQLSSIPHKRSVLDQIKAAREEAQAKAAQTQAQQAQVAEAAAASQIEERKSRAGLFDAQADDAKAKALVNLHKAHAGPVLDMFKAGVDAGTEQTPDPAAGGTPQPGDQGVSTAS